MNRLEAVILDGGSGEIEHGGTRLTVDAARGRQNGERVLVLVRPELLELEPSANGGAGGENTLAGEVITHTFLGSVTRLKILARRRSTSPTCRPRVSTRCPSGSG